MLHPNALEKLIQIRNSLLKEKYSGYFPFFPLYGISENLVFSKKLRDSLGGCQEICIYDEFVQDGILFFRGRILQNDNSIGFIIPAAVRADNTEIRAVTADIKKTGDIKLSSVFYKAHKIVNAVAQNFCDAPDKRAACDGPSERTPDAFEKISFKSIQIADCVVTDFEYSLGENFWIKTAQ